MMKSDSQKVKDDLDKLYRIEYESQELLEAVCDRICRYRDLDQEDLDEMCESCPLAKLGDMIDGE